MPMKCLALMTVLLSFGLIGNASAQVALDAEGAQQFLNQVLRDKTVNFSIGNDVSDRDFGLAATIPSVSISYKKKFLGGWSEYKRFPKPARIEFSADGFDNLNKSGGYDQCFTSVNQMSVTGATSDDARFKFPPDGLSKDLFIGDDVKWSYFIEGDPTTRFGGEYSIDWRRATFVRIKGKIGFTYFVLTTGERVPYAQISVSGDALSDYVENAIRVIRLSCRS